MIKKIICLGVVIVMIFSLSACIREENDTFEWTNENAVYATVKTEYVNEVIGNVEEAFKNFYFKKVYIVGKTIEIPQTTLLRLLFVLNESGTAAHEQFAGSLRLDERINAAFSCRDLPFETINTLYLEASSENIAVGEVTTITSGGYFMAYSPPFEFEGVWITLTDFDANKTYKKSDFPQVKVSSVETSEGRLFLKLSEPDYFNTIKAANVFSRISTIKAVEFERDNIIMPPPPIWEISDITIANFVNESDKYVHYEPITIVGVKQGKTAVRLRGVSIEITVS